MAVAERGQRAIIGVDPERARLVQIQLPYARAFEFRRIVRIEFDKPDPIKPRQPIERCNPKIPVTCLHDGSHGEAALAQTMGIALHDDTLLAADAESNAIREVDLDSAGGVRTIVGTGLFDFGDVDGVGDTVRLQHPQGIAVARGGRVILCDSYNDSLRWIDRAARCVTTWVRGLHEPGGIAIGERGVYVADTNAHRIAVADWASGELHPVEIVMP